MTAKQQMDMSLDLQQVDALYKKWVEEDSSMGEILNTKITKIKNVELRQKLDAWKAR